MRRQTMLSRLTLLGLAATLFAGSAFGETRDPMPIPQEVLQKLPGLRAGSATPPLVLEMGRHHQELNAIVERSQKAKRAPGQADEQPDEESASHMTVRAKLHELRQLSKRIDDDKSLPDTLKHGIAERIQTLSDDLSALESAGKSDKRQAAMDKLRGHLAQFSPTEDPEPPAPINGFTHATYPRLTTKDDVAKKRPAYASLGNSGTQLAFDGSPQQLAAALPAALDPSTCNYQAADLADDGRNVQLTSDIKKLAAQLEYSPSRIVDWVRKQVRFEPYFFATKGAAGTLQTKGGGSMDQASLLIALLRASNIPARYVLGDIIVHDNTSAGADSRVAKWLGVKTYAAANQLLAQGPFVNVNYYPDGSTATNATGVRVNHVWVEACVPYAHYRGNRLDGAGQRWIPLDSTFKQPDYQPGIPLDSVDIDYSVYLSKRSKEMPEERFKVNTRAYLQGLNPPRTIDEVPYSGVDSQAPMDILPTTLPYDVNAFLVWPGLSSSETAVLPDGAVVKLNVEFRDKNGTMLMPAYEALTPDIYFNRVTLGFDGVSAADRTAITNWRLDGSSTSALPCPRSVVPYINVEGVRKATGTTSVDLCTKDNTINMRLYIPWAFTAPGLKLHEGLFTQRIQAGNLHALMLGVNKVSEELLRTRAAKLLAAVRATSGDVNTNVEDIEGEFLNLVGLKYVFHHDDAANAISDLNAQTMSVTNALGMIATQTKVQKVLDLPFGVSRTGYLVDVYNKNSSIDIATGQLNLKAFKALAYAGSAYESYIWQENARTDAVSTVRGLQFANETGIPMLTATKSNWASTKVSLTNNASLNYTTAQLTALENSYFCSTCEDFSVTLPKTQIKYGDASAPWTGYVAAAESLNTTVGHIVMEISGGYNGGYSIFQPVSYTFDSLLNTGFSYYTPPPAPNYNLWTAPVYAPPATITPAIGLGITPYSTFGGDPVNLVNGNVYHNESDLNIKGRGGFNFGFDRAYNSREPKDGPLGFGWTHSLNQYIMFADDNPDMKAAADDTDHVVSSIVWVDGTGSRKAIASNGTTTFTTPSGFFFTVARQANNTFLITEKNGIKYTFENKNVPSPAPADEAAAFTGRSRLLSIQDRNGNTLTLSYVPATGCSGAYVCKVTDDLNRSLTFTYNAAGRLDTISDWTGRQWKYGYDSAGNLTSYKNPRASLNKQTGVTYNYYSAADGANLDHALKSYALPRGNGMTFEYYINGRAFRHYKTLHPEVTTTFTYNDFQRETVVTDERGNVRHHFFDRNGNTEKVQEPDGGVRAYTFDCRSTTDCPNPYNKLSETDPTGLTINYLYDSSGNMSKTSFPASSTTVERYDFGANTFGQPRRIKNARGNWTLMRYDTKGNLTDEIHLKAGVTPAACSSECAIPAASSIISWNQKQYDAYGNVTQTKRVRDFSTQAGPTLTVDFNDTANSVVGLNAVKLTRLGDKTGDGVIDSNDPSDVVSMTYDNLGRVKQGIDSAWYASNIDLYDEVDRPTKTSDALSRSHEIDYDANGNVTERRLVVAGTVLDRRKASFDDDDRAITTTDNAGAVTNVAYDSANNPIQAVNADSYQVQNEYDALNRMISAFDAEGNLTRRNYDIGGRIQSITNALNITRTFTYYGPAKEGRLKRATLPAIQSAAAGRATEYDYDAAGNVIRMSQIGSDGTTRDHLKFYDEMERVVREVSPAVDGSRRQVCRKYSNLGDLVEMWVGPTTDNTTATCNFSDTTLKKQVTYLYDDFGRRLKETDPLTRNRSWTYDFHGKVLTATDAKSQITTFTWKGDGQPDTRKDHAGRIASWTYFPNGQVQTVGDSSLTYTYTYDAAHRVQTVTDSRSSKKFTYSYSPGGLLNRMVDGESRITDYVYDGVGRMIGQWMPNGGFVSWGYDPDGRLSTRWSDDNVSSVYTWNADGSMASRVNKQSDGAVATSHVYTYNAFGQIDTHTENISTDTSNKWRYVYSDLGQLREAYKQILKPAVFTEALYRSYRYDAFGNRVRETTNSGTYNKSTYDDAQQLSRIDRYSAADVLQSINAVYSFDANGSVLSKATTYNTLTLTWNELNQLKTAKLQDSTSAVVSDQSYAYDAGGRRVSKTVGGATTSYLYNGGDETAPVYAQYTAWTDPQALIADGPGVDDPVARLPLSGGQFQAAKYYDADGKGTVDAVTIAGQSGTAALDGKVGYDAWGGLIMTGGTTPPQYGTSYQGRDRDETTLINFRARYYDADVGSMASGRFISRDPLGYGGGLNLYAAFDNDPVNGSDPTGTTAISPAAINGLIRDYRINQFLDDMGLGGLRSSNQSITYADRRPDPYKASTTSIVQTALGFASMVPGLGTVTGLANAGIDFLNGDHASAAISLASAIPFIGVEAGAIRAGVSAARGAETVAVGAARVEAAATSEVNYLYRGVAADHPAIDAARQGSVIPGNLNGTVSTAAHNEGGYAAQSAYTSWTRDPSIAEFHAAKSGPGGALLRVPQGPPSPGASWSWHLSDDIWGESEVLMKGVRHGVEVFPR